MLHLVSAAVPGLRPQNVSIVDNVVQGFTGKYSLGIYVRAAETRSSGFTISGNVLDGAGGTENTAMRLEDDHGRGSRRFTDVVIRGNQARNFERWPILGTYIWHNPTPVPETWEGEIAMVNVPGAMQERFEFTVRSDSVAAEINKLQGRRVSLVLGQLPVDVEAHDVPTTGRPGQAPRLEAAGGGVALAGPLVGEADLAALADVARTRPSLAVALAKYAMERIEDAVESVDDSDGHCSRLMAQARGIRLLFPQRCTMNATKSSCRRMLSALSFQATSGSIIQNSVRWRRVFDFSARKVGPKV